MGYLSVRVVLFLIEPEDGVVSGIELLQMCVEESKTAAECREGHLVSVLYLTQVERPIYTRQVLMLARYVITLLFLSPLTP